MTPNLIDHLLVALLVLVIPWLAMVEYRHLVRALEAGERGARTRAYRQTIFVQWGFAACLIGFWLRAERALPVLGLGLEVNRGLWVGLAFTLAACGLLVFQTVLVHRHPEARAAVRAQVATLRSLLPHSVEEGRWFIAVSVTAGTCEELVYRGFLMAYFGTLGPVPAIVLSTVVFGLSHAYMGRVGATRASLVGLVVAGLYWLTGSLWAPMLLHATADLTSGIMARTSFAPEPSRAGAGGSPLAPPPGAPQ